MKRFIILLFHLTLFSGVVAAQPGGRSTFGFLDLPNSARVAALGGKQTAIRDHDLNLVFHNPGLLSAEMDKNVVLNFVSYFADIHYGYVSYARHTKKYGNLAGGIHYVNYGKFIAADPSGTITGNFHASEYALNLLWSKPLDSTFTIGMNVKPVYSSLEKYRSYGLLMDAGITYYNEELLFSAALVIRNLGYQFRPYHDGNREPMPFEVQLGVSQKLKHAPFRFSLLLQHLQKFDLTYEAPGKDEEAISLVSSGTEDLSPVGEFAEKMMRHVIVGVEFTPIDHFFLRAGYNYQRRKELQVSSRIGMVGFSWGFGLRISRFHISYGRATYHLAGSSNHFSLSTDID